MEHWQIALLVLAWLGCFVFAWGYMWKHELERDPDPGFVSFAFVVAFIFAPLIVVGVPFGKMAIHLTKRFYK